MVKKLKDFKCPYCGETEFVKGKHLETGYSRSHTIVPISNFRIHRQQMLISVFCKNCGSLVREYIQKPELLENHHGN